MDDDDDRLSRLTTTAEALQVEADKLHRLAVVVREESRRYVAEVLRKIADALDRQEVRLRGGKER